MLLLLFQVQAQLIFYILDRLVKFNIDLGIYEKNSLDLVLHTASRSLHMLKKSNTQLAELCRKLTLPDGVTESALRIFLLGNMSLVQYSQRYSNDTTDLSIMF
ncbi:pyrroline-5-carboxylate reductase dimerization domain-containing protein [Acinetobacter baumannii]|uniref:pyrroline-5-carboxylate reductase dimerization domain-containing protein n=1 Tax=Acinetobacter baumannii TaxID=470 RepID=UPI0021F02684|nr:Pyrroline-5-carboxylate reductase [Acinetobacter baumannii]CAI3135341.1 Pyrroline-5-carboxylate reductase [Acinetobacter baumannii]CAI3135716.1 Pyrroline-5-carboxylate reductase [Acinetobacter baumannii]